MRHVLVGYDKKSELKAFELSIPDRTFQKIMKLIQPDADDPEMIGCYEADYCFFIEPRT